jgi:hypothetical protein
MKRLPNLISIRRSVVCFGALTGENQEAENQRIAGSLSSGLSMSDDLRE